MTKHDFAALYAQYPDVIAQMPDTFDSHRFIRTLAQENQALYVEALYDYRDSYHGDRPAPFRAVHRILSQHLNTFPHLVRRVGNVTTHDIFDQPQGNAQWEKI